MNARRARRERRQRGYLHHLLAAFDDPRLPEVGRPGTVTISRIYHDDWCSLLAGRGPCDCFPDIRFEVPRH